MLKSLNQFFKKSAEPDQEDNDNINIFVSLLLEAAAIDGSIDEKEIINIKNTIMNVFNMDEETSKNIINDNMKNIDDSKSFYFFTSKINKDLDLKTKILLLEALWEIVLADGKVHDFESNLIRRLSGLMYISNIDSANAKKRVLNKIKNEV